MTSLEQLAEIHSIALSDRSFAEGCRSLADEVRQGIAAWATGRHGRHGEIYAFEADGYGNQLFIDDGNAPSLLSLPYLGCCRIDDPLYQRTRAFVLSDDNPYFYKGTAGEGLGGPHSGLEMIWPLGIITRALTTRNEKEIAACLRTLQSTHAGTGFMHESFFRNNPDRFTRKWFAWANTLFGELILQILDGHPRLLALLKSEPDQPHDPTP